MPDRSKFSLSIQSIDAIGTAFLSIPRWKIESVIATVGNDVLTISDVEPLAGQVEALRRLDGMDFWVMFQHDKSMINQW